MSFSHAIGKTEKLKVSAAILPDPWKPVLAAKQLATIDYLTQGRIAINVVSGWFVANLMRLADLGLEHDERYVRSNLFVPSKVSGQLTITALMVLTNLKLHA